MSNHDYQITCPNCRRSGLFTEPHEQRSDLGCLLFVFGGFLPWLLYSASRSGRVQCMFCHYLFREPSTAGNWPGMILAIVLILFGLYLWIGYTLSP